MDRSALDYLEATQRGMHPKDVSMIATAETNLELLRLARLGLWAESIAVPALEAALSRLEYLRMKECGHDVPQVIEGQEVVYATATSIQLREALSSKPK